MTSTHTAAIAVLLFTSNLIVACGGSDDESVTPNVTNNTYEGDVVTTITNPTTKETIVVTVTTTTATETARLAVVTFSSNRDPIGGEAPVAAEIANMLYMGQPLEILPGRYWVTVHAVPSWVPEEMGFWTGNLEPGIRYHFNIRYEFICFSPSCCGEGEEWNSESEMCEPVCADDLRIEHVRPFNTIPHAPGATPLLFNVETSYSCGEFNLNSSRLSVLNMDTGVPTPIFSEVFVGTTTSTNGGGVWAGNWNANRNEYRVDMGNTAVSSGQAVLEYTGEISGSAPAGRYMVCLQEVATEDSGSGQNLDTDWDSAVCAEITVMETSTGNPCVPCIGGACDLEASWVNASSPSVQAGDTISLDLDLEASWGDSQVHYLRFILSGPGVFGNGGRINSGNVHTGTAGMTRAGEMIFQSSQLGPNLVVPANASRRMQLEVDLGVATSTGTYVLEVVNVASVVVPHNCLSSDWIRGQNIRHEFEVTAP